ncbi:hypothetical protein VPH35_049552 [Triticum aestivum]|uniref:Uncharacterized protein n=1 Tax=Triticum aestivum TaxID=4565 RepID=A0A077RV96_WHEAT|nr:unnamed protein product [Triticum aestivum]
MAAGDPENAGRLVNNYNDITHHFLYYIYVHLDLAKAKKSASQPQLMHQLGTKFHPLIISIYAACQPHGDQTDEEKEAARKKRLLRVAVLILGAAISQLWEEHLLEGVTCGITCIDLSLITIPRMRDRLAKQGFSDKFTDLVDSPFPSSVHAMLLVIVRLLIQQAPYCAT